MSLPGGFASLAFDQVVPKNSQRHLHFASIRLCLAFLFIISICKQESLPKLGKCIFTEKNFQYCKHPSFFSSVNSLFGGSFLSKNFSHLLNLKFLAATSQRKNMVSGMKKPEYMPEYMPECNQSRLRT